MSKSNLLSNRVRVVGPKEVSADRYQFLDLSQAEPNLGVPLSGSISSGSLALVASDIDGNRFFVTSINLEQFSGSFSGSFAGDGSQLNNVRLLQSGSASAQILSDEFIVNIPTSIYEDLVVSGSLTVLEDTFLRGNLYVENAIYAEQIIVTIVSSSILYSSGSNKFGDEIEDKHEFTGSVDISGSLSASFISGDGSGLFNIPLAAFTQEVFRIASGSVTASVSPDFGFRVESSQFGSEFTGSVDVSGSIFLSSGSLFSGSGAGLFNIPRSALAPDALESVKIATGSVTASVSNERGFVVESITSGSTFSGSIFLSSGSVFSGSGRDLFNIPRSALAPDALESVKIATGSITASVSIERGFVVESVASGSTFSGSIFLSSGSVFSGSGRDLFNIPRSALTEDALLSSFIVSGSVTASVSPTEGFIVRSVESGSLFFGDLRLISGSVFSGSGRDLFNIPRSALTEDALLSSFIVSGSVTASVSPDLGFVVTSVDSGSLFFGDVKLASGSVFSGSGRDLFEIPFSALSQDAQDAIESLAAIQAGVLASGSVTASVSDERGFVVESVTSGSIFSGSVFLSSGSFFSGSGAQLFDIPQSALAFELNKIASGSVTASVSPDRGFEVNAPGTFSGSVSLLTGSFSGSGAQLFDIPIDALRDLDLSKISTGSFTASLSPQGGLNVNTFTKISGSLFVSSSTHIVPTGSLRKTYYVTNSGSQAYIFDEVGADPTLKLVRNVTYTFTVSASGHPFWIKTTPTTGTSNVYNEVGLTNNGTEDGVITFTPQTTAPNTLYYISENSSNLQGIFQIVNNITYDPEIKFQGDVTLTGSLGVRDRVIAREFSGSFSGSFFGDGGGLTNLPASDFAIEAKRIASGSVTASVSPNEGFVLESIEFGSTQRGNAIITGSLRTTNLISTENNIIAAGFIRAEEFTGSFSGSFQGDGSRLNNIPFSAFSGDVTRIASGSVTASVIPERGFIVESLVSGSEFTGSVDISGSLFVAGGFIQALSGSFFSGSGRGLFDIPQSALSFEINQIASGSVTASVSPNFGFRVESLASGSEFTGSIDVSGSVLVSGSLTARDVITAREFTGSFSGSFQGDGSRLINLPASELSLNALRLASGSATASIAPNTGLLVNTGVTIRDYLIVTGSSRLNQVSASVVTAREFTGSFSGSFQGDGSRLNNIPRSAIVEEAFRIASGSATASISPVNGFVVNTSASIDGDLNVSGKIVAREILVEFISASVIYSSGSNIFGDSTADRQQLTGSVEISGSLTVDGVISGDGAGLFNIPRSALTEDAARIASGSVTASVSPDFGFVVTSKEFGSTLTGSLKVSGSGTFSDVVIAREFTGSFSGSFQGDYIGTAVLSGSFSGSFAGDGSQLNNIPISALSEDAPRIASGSVTASIAPNTGLVINTRTTITGSLLVSASGEPLTLGELDTLFDVTNNGSSAYLIDSASNPTLTLVRGVSYTFDVNAGGHPFWFQTTPGAYDSNNVYLDGVQNAGTDDGIIIFALTGSSIPDTLYYVCQNHASMGGEFSVVDVLYSTPVIRLEGPVEVTGSVNVTDIVTAREFSGSFSGSFAGDGSELTNLPASEFAIEAIRLSSGSVTASVSPENGFVVESQESGSTFYGNITIPSGSGYFSGSGEALFNIPRAALTPDALLSNLIVSGAATASIDELRGLEVNVYTSITGGLYVSSSARLIPTASLDTEFEITTDASSYLIDGVSNANLKLVRGLTYTFNIDNTTGHPFWIKTLFESGSENSYDDGIDVNGIDDGVITFFVSSSVPNTLYYVSENSEDFGGTLSIVDEYIVDGKTQLLGLTEIIGTLDVTGSVGISENLNVVGTGSFGKLDVETVTTTNVLVANHITASSITASFVDFVIGENTVQSVPGRLKWNEADGTLDLGMGSNATLQVGQELYYPYVVNKTGAPLVEGTLVMVDPIQTVQGNRLRVVKAITDGTYSEDLLVGVLTENIDDNQQGFATWFGYVRELNQTALEDAGVKDSGSAWTEGSLLYPNPLVPGGLTTIKPEAPNLKTSIAAITRIAGQNITILVRPHLGAKLGGLHDVQIVSSSNYDILVYNSGSQRWENRNFDLQLSGSFSGSFQGDGSGLTNIDLSNLSLDSSRIFSGSVTASVNPEYGFRVESIDSGSEFTGSINVSGSVTISGIYTGDGSGLTNIDIANLAFDTTRIFTGSVTASVDKDGFFRVEDSNGPIKSEFSGSVFVSESVFARFFVGDGSQLQNVTAEAAPRISFEFATASVDSGTQFIVTTNATGSQIGSQFTGSVSITGSITASLFQGDGGGLFNIPLEALENLELDRINSGSGVAVIDPDKLLVNVPITASRYDGDGSGLFNIPAESLVDLELDRIVSGSVSAIISPNKGLEVNTSVEIFSGSLFVTGGINVTGSDVVLASGSRYVGDGSGLTNINIANLSFETSLLQSGSAIAQISPNLGFEINVSTSIDGTLTADRVVASEYVYSGLISGGLVGTYTFEGNGPTASVEYDILRYDEARGYYVPQPELSLTETVPFSNVDELTIVHNLEIKYPVVQI